MKIGGMMVCGPNEPYLKEVLDQFERLRLSPVFIVGNNIDRESMGLISSYGFYFYEDNREWGKFQPKIKSDLLKQFLPFSPDWIVACDADEIFDEAVTRQSLEALAQSGIAWNFYVVNYWNDTEHYAKGLSFWNVRFFKFTPEYGLEFVNKPVHCGLAPPMQYRFANDSPYILWHYGLMDKAKRLRKVERYKTYDPNAAYKSDVYYAALADETPPAELNKEDLRRRVIEDVTNRKMKSVPQNIPEPEGFVFMRKDNRVIDVQKKDQRRYEKQGWKFDGDVVLNAPEATTVAPPISAVSHECTICGEQCGTEAKLKAHKKTHAENSVHREV